MESHVTSLELSKRLKELGVKQNSIFSWYFYYVETDQEPQTGFTVEYTPTEKLREGTDCSAFLASELGEILPDWVYSVFNEERWDCMGGGFEFHFTADTECDARAKMLIYLLEQGIINVED